MKKIAIIGVCPSHLDIEVIKQTLEDKGGHEVIIIGDAQHLNRHKINEIHELAESIKALKEPEPIILNSYDDRSIYVPDLKKSHKRPYKYHR